MATDLVPSLIDQNVLRDLRKLLWGTKLQDEVFSRWSQGFIFSPDDRTALMQLEGGPCAVLAPVQAFLIRTIIFSRKELHKLHSASDEEVSSYLSEALGDMILMMRADHFVIVCFEDSMEDSAAGEKQNTITVVQNPSTHSQEIENPKAARPNIPDPATPHPSNASDLESSGTPLAQSSGPLKTPETGRTRILDAHVSEPPEVLDTQNNSTMSSEVVGASSQSSRPCRPENRPTTSTPRPTVENGASCPKRRKNVDQEDFHRRLRCITCLDEASMRGVLRQCVASFRDDYGVLLFLYSLLLTKGLDEIKADADDLVDPLIDGTFGHGSQPLINLMITGTAVSYVFDNEKVVTGYALIGIQRQSPIGYLTIHEHYRYCEVGWFLKNPQFPIWVLGSETHLTVLFSDEPALVVADGPAHNAKTVFSKFDPEGNGFISTSSLADVMSELDLVSEKEYVELMTSKMDSEQLGIITLNSFLTEFFPDSVQTDQCTSFRLFHYNGLPRSNRDSKVMYCEAAATLEDSIEVQFLIDVSPMKFCLQTKWPSINVQWKDEHIPSLN